MSEILTSLVLLFLVFALLSVLSHLKAIRRYTLAQFHLKLTLSNLDESQKSRFAGKYGLGLESENS